MIKKTPNYLSALLKPAEKLPNNLNFVDEGFLSPFARGDQNIRLENNSNNAITLALGSHIGYLILSPFRNLSQ